MMRIEIDITYRCNKSCPNCDRFGSRDDRDMSVDQIKNFLSQVKKPLDRIRVSGGEPRLHPQFEQIIRLILDSKCFVDFDIMTNTPSTEPYMRCLNPFKQGHNCVYLTAGGPGKFCEIPFECGLSLNKFGYLTGGHCSAVAMFFDKMHLFRQTLPEGLKDFPTVEKELCSLCSYGSSGIYYAFKESEYGVPISKAYREIIMKNGAGRS